MTDKKAQAKVEDKTDSASRKTCFIIMPIADHPDYASGHFSRVYKHIIVPACEKAGFAPTLASDIKSANLIIADILKRILHADMAICDLSSRNPNVLYELGIRQAFDMPVALIKDDSTRETFDIQGIRYLEYDKELRIDLVQQAIDSLAEVIIETYENKDKDVFSLVQILGREKAALKTSEVSEDTLAILEAIRELRPSSNSKLNNDADGITTQVNAPFSVQFPLNGFTEGGAGSVLYYLKKIDYVVSAHFTMTDGGNPLVTIRSSRIIPEMDIRNAIKRVGTSDGITFKYNN